MTPINQFRPMHTRQRGAILATSLLLLIILTVLGVAMMRMTTMQERMAGNTRDMNLALQAAESALRDGEDRLSPARLAVEPAYTSYPGCVFCEVNSSLPVDATQYDWSAGGTATQEYGTVGTQDIAGVAADPRYLIVHLEFVRDSEVRGFGDTGSGRHFFQITARSTGASGQANTILQSTFPRRFN